MTVHILGGGPAGLYTGLQLLKRGFEVRIYERKPDIGLSQHCTGIVSKRTIENYGLSQKLVLNKFKGVSLKISDDLIEVRTSIPKAYRIDRYLFEKELEHRVLNLGGDIILNYYDVSKIRSSSEYIVDATGSISYIKDIKSGFLPSLQLEFHVTDSKLYDLFDDETVYLFFDKELNRDFFIWLVKYLDRYIIGSASLQNLHKILRNALLKWGIRNYNIITRYYGFLIVGGPRRRFYSDKRDSVYVGDSAGQTKPSTGGGLYYISIASRILSKKFPEGELDYSTEFYKILGKEIALQKLARLIFLELDNKEFINLVEIMSRKELLNMLLLYGDMDYHATSILNLIDKDILKYLFKHPRIISEGIKIISSIF